MGTDIDKAVKNPRITEDAELKILENDFEALQQEAQSLLKDKLYLENEISDLKKRASSLDNELRITLGLHHLL